MMRAFMNSTLIFSSALGLLMALQNGCGSSLQRSSQFTFFPAAPDTARYQFLTRISSSEDVKPQGGLNKAILGEQPKFSFGKPYGITMSRGRIFVVDTQLKGIIRIDLEKKEMVLLQKFGNVPLINPINISTDSAGHKYICDIGAHRIFVFDENDELLTAIGDGESFLPLDVAVGENYLYVVDKATKSVLMLDPKGEKLGEFDASADSLGNMAWPTNIAVAPDGRVYVVDTMRARVYCFDAEGNYLFGFGERGDVVGMFARPKGIAIDQSGNPLVVDAAFENVQVFDPTGRALTFLGGPQSGVGRMILPAGVEVVYDDLQFFERFIHSGVRLDHVVLVTNQFGPSHIDIIGRISNVSEFARRYPPDLGYKDILAGEDTTQ